MHVINDIKIQDHITMISTKYSYSTTKKTYELLNQFFKYYYSSDINNNPSDIEFYSFLFSIVIG